MILPDLLSPQQCLYYKGTIIVRVLKQYGDLHVSVLYERVKEDDEMSFSLFLISLEWLYIVGVVSEFKGIIKLCI